MKHSQETDPESRNASQVPATDERAIEPVNSSRRRFTRAGLSGSVLMTLASRPALANHCSVSGAMSGNMSRAPGTPGHVGDVSCAGLAPLQWVAQTTWCGIYTPDTVDNGVETLGTLLSDPSLFGLIDTPLDDPTILTMTQAMTKIPNSLVAHVCAGLLNACEYGEAAYGYSIASFQTYITNGAATNPGGLLLELQKLNSSGSRK